MTKCIKGRTIHQFDERETGLGVSNGIREFFCPYCQHKIGQVKLRTTK